MKPIIFLFSLFMAAAAVAQDCNSSLLFKEGTKLMFRTYEPKGGVFSGGKLFEVTRLNYSINRVTDSNGIRYSFVTKTGTNPYDENLTYHVDYVLTCDGTKITVPFNFYKIDTVYFSNIYPKSVKDKGIYAASIEASASSFYFPVEPDKGTLTVSDKNISETSQMRDYELTESNVGGRRGNRGYTGRIIKNIITTKTTIRNIDTKGKVTVTTPAGKYECQKVVINATAELAGNKIPYTITLYYNAEVGIVRVEPQLAKYQHGYAELAEVTQ